MSEDEIEIIEDNDDVIEIIDDEIQISEDVIVIRDEDDVCITVSDDSENDLNLDTNNDNFKHKTVVKDQFVEVSKSSSKSANNSDTVEENEGEALNCDAIDQSSSDEENLAATNAIISNNYDYSRVKWIKPLSNLSSPPHLQIVIIDRNHQYWKITKNKWLMIEKRLLKALNSEMVRSNDTTIGLFDGAKWQKGYKVIGCHSENALNFITKFILNLDKLWHGAKLDVFPITSVTRRVIKVFIPQPILNTELIVSLIKLQNPSIYTKDWKIVRECKRPNNSGLDIWFSINERSCRDLFRTRGEIKYGINRIWANRFNLQL